MQGNVAVIVARRYIQVKVYQWTNFAINQHVSCNLQYTQILILKAFFLSDQWWNEHKHTLVCTYLFGLQFKALITFDYLAYFLQGDISFNANGSRSDEVILLQQYRVKGE